VVSFGLDGLDYVPSNSGMGDNHVVFEFNFTVIHVSRIMIIRACMHTLYETSYTYPPTGRYHGADPADRPAP
jgi:hypothetical protein